MRDAANKDASASRSSRAPRGYPRSCRLLRGRDFDRVYRAGQRRSSRQFVVFFCLTGATESRFGTSVKTALGGAVVRNRIKRRIREIVRLHRQEIATGWDIVIHPRSSVARAEFGALARELVSLLQAALKPAASTLPRAPHA